MKRFFHKLFIPHRANDHRPHLLRDGAIVFFLAVILISEIYFLSITFIGLPTGTIVANVLSSSVVNLTNANRKDDRLISLATNPILEKAAQLKANDMAAKGYFSHNSPDGKTPWYWIQQAGYQYQYAGENLAINFFDSKDVVDAWMNSKEHRSNILNKDFTEIGIAVAEGDYKGSKAIFVVQFFGKPKVGSVTVTLSAPPKQTEQGAVVAALPNTAQVKGETAGYTPAVSNLLASPRHTVNDIYIAFGILLLVLGGIAFNSKARIHHPKLVTRSFVFVAVLLILMVFNKQLVLFYGVIQ